MLRQTAGLYQSATDWVNYPGDGPDGDNYSVLDTLESCRAGDGKLDIKIVYPQMDGSPSNTWRQTTNPVTATAGGVDVPCELQRFAWAALHYKSSTASSHFSRKDWWPGFWPLG
jgi:hypothetical protein